MNKMKVLIISDKENQHYWKSLTGEAREKTGSTQITLSLEEDISHERIDQQYDVILMDISDIEDLFRMIPEIHAGQPGSRIIIVRSTPTWKFAREVLRLGAADLIRKNAHPAEIIEELSPL